MKSKPSSEHLDETVQLFTTRPLFNAVGEKIDRYHPMPNPEALASERARLGKLLVKAKQQ